MLPSIFFVFLGLVSCALAYATTASALRSRYQLDGPGPIARALRSRNRLLVGGVLLVVSALALVEAFVAPWHAVLLDLQFAVSADPIGVLTFGSGAGVSWALYLAVLLGVIIGLVSGAYMACQRGSASSTSIRLFQLILK